MIGRFFQLLTKMLVFCVILICLAFVWIRWAEPSLLSTTKVELNSSGLPGPAEGLRIAQFTDTHFGFDYDVKRFERAVEKINAFEPPIVVFTGDLYEEYAKYPADDEAIIAALSSLRAPQGKYAVLGNHDYGRGADEESIRILEAGGFTVLRNESMELPLLGITVTGVDDLLFGSGGTFDFSSLAEDTYNLVLCHEPDVFAGAANTAVDLMLAGHTHGGQVRVPVLGELILPQYGRLYPMGQYAARNVRGSQLFVSRGLGTSNLPLRFCCMPEVALITLHTK